MKELNINGKAITSIWKTNAKQESSQTQNIKPKRQAYRDPTANAAIGNIMREERKQRHKKQQLNNQGN